MPYEDIQKEIQEGIKEILTNPNKINRPACFVNARPMTPEEYAAYKEQCRLDAIRREEAKRVFKLTHKTNDWVNLYCPKCGRVFDHIWYDEHITEYEYHVKDCVKDCKGCDSFESDGRCAVCFMYSMWRGIEDG